MNIKILGSGGCVALPRPTCQCNICMEARKKGEPYKRTGSSLYIEDINIIIDTSEEINYQINRENIFKIDGIMYSHWDPDHSLGMRVIEQLHEGWRYKVERIPTKIYALPEVMDDLLAIKNKFSGYLEYYSNMRLCKIIKGDIFKFDKIEIKLFPVITNIVSTIFLLSEGETKIIYAPCDIKPFPIRKEFIDSQVLIIGASMPRGKRYTENNPALYYIEEIIEIGKSLNIKKIIITHIEEQWGVGYDEYKSMEETFKGYLSFAYDSMCISI